MSYAKPLVERERALEEAFFRRENARLLEEMRARRSRAEQFDALSAALGVRQAKIIDPLLDMGLREENVTALVMAPLVAVAWADRRLDDDERRLLIEAEQEHGIEPDSEAARLFDHWLEHRPHPEMLDAWSAYVSELCRVLDARQREQLREDVVSWSWEIARAIDRTIREGHGPSRAERAVIERIEQAFGSDGGGDGSGGGGDQGRDPSGVDDAIASMS